MNHNTIISIITVVVLVVFLAVGWLAEDIRVRREAAKRDR